MSRADSRSACDPASIHANVIGCPLWLFAASPKVSMYLFLCLAPESRMCGTKSKAQIFPDPQVSSNIAALVISGMTGGTPASSNVLRAYSTIPGATTKGSAQVMCPSIGIYRREFTFSRTIVIFSLPFLSSWE